MLVLPRSPRYEFPLSIANPVAHAKACEILDTVRPGHTLRGPTFVAYYINNMADALLLANHLTYIIKDQPTGFDFETKGWAPRVRLVGLLAEHIAKRTGKKPKAKATVGISPCHPKYRSLPVTFQISWGVDTYVVAAEFLYMFAQWLTQVASLDGANLAFESHTSKNVSVPLHRFHRDLLQMHYQWDENEHQRMGTLKAVTRAYLGLQCKDFDEVFDEKIETYESVLAVDPARAIGYAALDPHISTLGCYLFEHLLADRNSRPGYTGSDIYARWERPYQFALIRMEEAGFPIKASAIRAHFDNMTARIEELDQNVFKLVGKSINLSSNVELSRYYYGERGIPVVLTTDGKTCVLCKKVITKVTGYVCPVHGRGALVNTASVDDQVLEGLAKKGDMVAKALQERRTIDKARSTWIDGYHKYASGADCGFPSINGAYVVSGRLAAGIWLTTPEEYRDILGFDGDNDEGIIGGDYSQLELRILAHNTGDEMMLDAFRAGRDLHSWTAAITAVFKKHGTEVVNNTTLLHAVYEKVYAAHEKKENNLPLTVAEKALLEERFKAKRLNFGIVYGMGPEKLAVQIGCSVVEANEIFNAIWMVYSRTKAYYDQKIAEVTKTGEMQTILGRNRRIPELASTSPRIRGYGERLVKNTPCQAGAGDVIRGAMIQVDLDAEAGGLYGTMGRMAYGSFADDIWKPDFKQLPIGWAKYGLPVALANNIGELGRLGYRMILQCHDELLFRGPKKNAEAAKARIKAIMEDPFGADVTLQVPLAVNIKSGDSWASVK